MRTFFKTTTTTTRLCLFESFVFVCSFSHLPYARIGPLAILTSVFVWKFAAVVRFIYWIWPRSHRSQATVPNRSLRIQTFNAVRNFCLVIFFVFFFWYFSSWKLWLTRFGLVCLIILFLLPFAWRILHALFCLLFSNRNFWYLFLLLCWLYLVFGSGEWDTWISVSFEIIKHGYMILQTRK